MYRSMKTRYRILLFLMIWVYFSLNARSFNIPGSHILRWIFPLILIGNITLLKKWKIVRPPSLLIWFLIAVSPSIGLSAAASTSLLKALSFTMILYGSYIIFCFFDDVNLLLDCFHILAIVLIIYQILDAIYTLLGIGYDTGRSTGITTNANTLGVYSNLAFWAIVFMMINMKKKSQKIFLLILLLTTVYTSLASGSRTAFIVLGINVIIVGSVLLKKMFFVIPYWCGCLYVVYFVLSGKLNFLNITALNRLMEAGGTSRQNLWDAAILVWEQHPLFGVGYTISGLFNTVERGMAFHNSFLSFLVECGVWGCIFLGVGMLMFLGNTIHSVFVLIKKGNIFYPFLIALLMLLNLLIAAWSESFLFAVGSTEGFTFWFLVAWMLAYLKIIKKDKEQKI